MGVRMEKVHLNRFRTLTVFLLCSGALNIGLIATLVVFTLREARTPFAAVKINETGAEEAPNSSLLQALLQRSFPELVAYLTNRDPVEDGYLKRDLALSALCAAYFFDLEKAIGAAPLQKRRLFLSSEKYVELYPALSEEQFDAIVRYAYREKWPLTFEGLFHALKQKSPETREDSLCSALFSTAEFHSIQTLFQKTGAPVDPHVLLSLLAEAPWEPLRRFLEGQSKLLDLSLERRRSFLLEYLSYGSPSAARLLLKTDFSFSKSRLQDAGILALLNLLEEPDDLAQRFCFDLLQSPRTDAVREKAADKLAQFFPGAPFLAGSLPEQTTPSLPHAARVKEHIVQEGDTLWKIARLHKVKLEDLVHRNALEKDRLVPGMVLSIP